MPIVRFIKNEKQNPSSMKGSIDYCLQKFKTVDSLTGKRYVSGINCSGLNAYKEFMTTKLANHANKQAGKMNESMLSELEQRNNLLNELKKKWIPIFFGTMIGVQVLFQIVSILLEIYLN